MEIWEKVVKESFRKVRAFKIYKRDKLIISKRSMSLKTRGSEKGTVTLYFLSLTSYILYVSGITLRNNYYGRKKSNTADPALKVSAEIDIIY